MKCQVPQQKKCAKGHKTNWRCFEDEPKTCKARERERKIEEARVKMAAEEQFRQEEDRVHQKAVAKYDEDIQKIAQSVMDIRLRDERMKVITQKKQDLIRARERAKKATTQASEIRDKPTQSTPTISSPTPEETTKTVVTPKATQRRALLREHINSCVDQTHLSRGLSGSDKRTKRMLSTLR